MMDAACLPLLLNAPARVFVPTGVVVLMMDTKIEPAVAKDMIKGAPDLMVSEFHLG